MLSFVIRSLFFLPRLVYIILHNILYIRKQNFWQTKTIASLLLKSIVLENNLRTFSVLYIYLRYKKPFIVFLYTINYINRNDYIHVCISMYRKFLQLRYLESSDISKFFSLSRQVLDIEVKLYNILCICGYSIKLYLSNMDWCCWFRKKWCVDMVFIRKICYLPPLEQWPTKQI